MFSLQNESVKCIKNGTPNTIEPQANEQKSSDDDRNETRVISLDTIIRKGLNEKMPMTAKDIDNIVPNAIKQQQDANLKQSEKLALEKEFNLVYESSEDYNSSGDEKFDELVEPDHIEKEQSNEEDKSNDEREGNEEEKANEERKTDETSKSKGIEPTVDNENENHDSPQPSCEAVLEDKTCSDTAGTAPDDTDDKSATDGNDGNEPHVDVEALNANSNESNDSTSDQSFDDFDSDTDTTHSSHKKRKRRKSSATQNKFKDDLSKKTEDVAEDMVSDTGPRLNRRGKPRKSYDETDSEQVKKKVGRKLKIQRYAGPKRPGVRVSIIVL